MAAPSVAPPRAEAPGDEADEGVTDALSKEVFSTYACRSVDALGVQAVPHPGDIAEPASLAAVPLPASSSPYPLKDSFPPAVITAGKLSDLQLEGVLHACTKHLSWLPSGERAGFFIGDGAGVGKGRQIAATIIDSFVRGRRKAAWVTTSTDLYADAVRDLRDLGAHIPVIQNLQALDRATNTPTEGVLFLTYSTLTSTIRGRPRAQQLAEWLGGAAFDGVLIFDEAHRMKNFSSKEGQGTKVAATAVELQRALPAARVVYCSATGVSEVGNMAYLSRLGLFGAGTAFPTFDAFLSSLKRKGISFMELLAMELKGQGFYVCRGLSFRSAEFLELEVSLTAAQIGVYDAAVQVWCDLRAALHEALAAIGPVEGKDPWKPFYAAQQRFFKLLCVSMKVPTVVREAQEALAGGGCVVIGLQSTGEAAADALNLQPGETRGWVSVTREILLQFVANHFPTTRPQQAPPAGSGADGDGSNGMAAAAAGSSGATHGSGTALAEEISQAVGLKEELLARIQALELPPNFLDELIDELGGKGAVAEMTGRKGRVVRDVAKRGRPVYELRAKPDSSEMDSLNIREKEAFMAGKKLVAIVSDAASTGISLHASLSAGNRRRRVHLTIELPWSADKAIQQLGRSHRSAQASAPLYKLVFTDLGGERRFAAAVARRLQSLGALTRGDRRAASGLDLGSLNYDSPLGRKALRRMYDALVQASPLLPPGATLDGVLEGVAEHAAAEFRPRGSSSASAASAPGGETAPPVSAADVVDAVTRLHLSLGAYVDIMGIGLSAPRSDTVAEDVSVLTAAASAAAAAGAAGGSKDTGDVRRFLNRLLAVPCERQRLLFNYFQLSLEAEIRAAKAAGSYTEGVSDLPGQRISRAGPPEVLWTDPLTGLQTLCHHLAVDRGASFASALSRLQHEARHGDRSGFYASRRAMPGSGRTAYMLALQKPGTSGTFAVVRPNTGPSFFEMDLEDLRDTYARCSSEEAQEPWEEAYTSSLHSCVHGGRCNAGATCQVGRRLTSVCILTGSVVRIWDVLERALTRHEAELSKADRTMRIVRVEFGSSKASPLPEINLTSPEQAEGAAQEDDPDNQQHAGGSEEAPSLPLIGLRYPGHLLPHVMTALEASQEAGGAAIDAAAGGRAGHTPAVATAAYAEYPTPVDAKAFRKAFSAPKTLVDFFQPAGGKKRPAEAVPEGGSAAAAAAPPAKAKRVPAGSDQAAAGRVLFEKNNSDDTGAAAKPGSMIAKPAGSACAGEGECTDADVAALCAMGFARPQAERALRATQGPGGGDVERAANWLLSS